MEVLGGICNLAYSSVKPSDFPLANKKRQKTAERRQDNKIKLKYKNNSRGMSFKFNAFYIYAWGFYTPTNAILFIYLNQLLWV